MVTKQFPPASAAQESPWPDNPAEYEPLTEKTLLSARSKRILSFIFQAWAQDWSSNPMILQKVIAGTGIA
jgi:hypothetical protein